MNAHVSSRLPKYLGRYEHSIDRRGRLSLPAAFRRETAAGLLVVAPIEKCVQVIPAAVIQDNFGRGVPDPHWTRDVAQIVRNNHIYPVPPRYAAKATTPSLAEATAAFEAEWAAYGDELRRLTGREFERFAAEVFGAHGFAVQGNVRIHGAAADLVLLQADHHGHPVFSIVECKQYGSGGRVPVREVVRLYGLGEALGRSLPTGRHFLITTSSLTGPAQLFAEQHEIDVIDQGRLNEWLQQVNMDGMARLPLFRVVSIAKAGTITLGSEFREYLRAEGTVEVNGMIDRIELRMPGEFAAKSEAAYAQQLAQIFA